MIDEEDVGVKCAECGLPIDIGRDAIRVQNGVLGTRGFVPLDGEMLFCSDECHERHSVADETVRMKRRVP